MADRISLLLSCILLVAAAGEATAMELDTLLPTEIPGYGASPVVSVLDRPHPQYSPVPIDLGNISLYPNIEADAGYDSNPNGAANGSSVFDFNPNMIALDPILGLGAYAAGNFTDYPTASQQNLSGYAIALGEHALLPRETLDFGAAAIAAQETDFSLNTVAVSKPINVSAKQIQGSDAVVCGMVTLTPEISITDTRFSEVAAQNRADYRQALTGDFNSGGPARFVILLHATESIYRATEFNADTYSILAGIADEATGLWKIRLLGGAATRQAVTGRPVTAPVLETSISWMPGDLDSVKLDLAREMDDPDQESAAGYTLSQTELSLAHEYLRNVIITGSFKFSHAAYFNSARTESLYTAGTAIDWHLNRALAVSVNYAFNDRQANFLKAANQHVFTVGITWSP